MLPVWIGIVDVVAVALLGAQTARTLTCHPGERVPVSRLLRGRRFGESERPFWWTWVLLVVLWPGLG